MSIGFTRRSGSVRDTHASLRHLLAAYPHALPLVPLPPPVASPPHALNDPGGGDQGKDPMATASHGCVTALVFGREESGLSEEELRLCTLFCAIPTAASRQASMNLSHAVAVVLAQMYERRALPEAPGSAPASARSDVASPSVVAPPAAAAPLPLAAAATAERGLEGAASGVPAVGGSSVSDSGGASSSGGGSGGGRAGSSGAGYDRPDAALLPAAAAAVEALLSKVAAIAAAAGEDASETRGGGGNHGRRRLALGYLRSVLGRSRITAGEVRSLHGLATAVLKALTGGGRGGGSSASGSDSSGDGSDSRSTTSGTGGS